jgi:tyrosine-protein kinase Etk/Wzc
MNRSAETSAASPTFNADDAYIRTDMLRFVAGRWRVVCAAMLAGVLAACVFAALTVPQYAAEALLQVDATKPFALSATGRPVDDISAQIQRALSVSDQVELIRSRAVLMPVLERYRLDIVVRPRQFAPFSALAQHLDGFGLPLWVRRLRTESSAGSIGVDRLDVPFELENKQLTVRVTGAGTYELSGPDKTPLLKGHVGALEQGGGVSLRIDRLDAPPGAEFSVTRQNVVDALQRFQDALSVMPADETSGMVLVTYENPEPARAADIANAVAASYVAWRDDEARRAAHAKLAALELELPAVQARAERSERLLAQFRQSAASVQPSSEARSYLAEQMNTGQLLAQLRGARVQSLRQFTENSEQVRAIDRQIGLTEAREAGLQRRYAGLPQVDRQSIDLQRDAQSDAATYQALMQSVVELTLVGRAGISDARLVDPALRPFHYAKPKLALVLAGGAVFGLSVGVLFLFFLHRLLGVIGDANVLERDFGLRVFGEIPRSAAPFRIDHSHDAVRKLCFELMTRDGGIHERMLAIASAQSCGDRSRIAAQTAAILARAGHRVLLIDADLWHGDLSALLALADAPGLSTALDGRCDIDAVLQPTSTPRLTAMSAGERLRSPSAALMHARLRTLLAACRARFDIIVLDAPPVLSCNGSLLARCADETVLVLPADRCRMRDVGDMLVRLRLSGAHVAGALITGVSRRADTYRRREAGLHTTNAAVT